MNPEFLAHISTAIQDATQRPFSIHRTITISGGSINQTLRLESIEGSCYFLKFNHAQYESMFIAEAAGLAAIAATNTIRVPRFIARGTTDHQSYLVLEHVELRQHGDVKQLGQQLASLHQHAAPGFGFAADNFIGTTAQPNKWKNSWIDFWCEQRLEFQLSLAAENGHNSALQILGKKLLNIVPTFFNDYTPQPSLLHGDLWGGNHAFSTDGTPIIFDPAAYYGDRECDLAMTELFGGYSADFYAAYHATWPMDSGYTIRRDLYNLYHILNHANLFGGDYVTQAERTMRKLLS